MPTTPVSPAPSTDRLCAFFRSGDALRSRGVGPRVLHATLALPPLPARMLADCHREIRDRLGLQLGDVEPLSLARARTRWPDYRLCVQTLADWAVGFGLDVALADAEQALMACRGARFHHDGGQYGGAAFCNLFLGDDRGLDLLFPLAGLRIALVRGTAVVFDTCQPHAVVPRGRVRFDPADFTPGKDWDQLFLTWELPVEAGPVARALGVVFDTRPNIAATLNDEQLWLDDGPLLLRADIG